MGYEVHDDDVYHALFAAGKPFKITELGRHAYRNAHTEGSIPQVGTHWPSVNPPFPVTIVGRLPSDHTLVYRSPIGLGWENHIKFDHEFPGKEALRRELAPITTPW